MNILIVDDKPENSYLLESLLNGNGYETASAQNGKEALTLALENKFALIISDILMPVMDGFTFCRECKKNELLKDIPFIFYTATYTSVKDEKFALSLGADKFLSKPQDLDTFIEIIKEVLSGANKKKIRESNISDVREDVVLKTYNSILIQKLEDKMTQAEEAEKELRKINAELQKEIEEHKIAESALRTSEEKFRITFEDASVGMSLTTLDGRFILVNNALCKMLGYTKEELINKQFIDFTHKDDIGLSLHWMEEMVSGETRMNRFEKRFIHKNGNSVFSDINLSLIKDSNNSPLFFVAHMLDITERKLAEKRITLLAHSIKSVSECISITDDKDYIVFVNDAFLKTYDYTEEEVIGKHISFLRPKRAKASEEFANILPETIKGGWKGEVINRRKDGTEFPILLSTSVIKDDNDKPIALIGIASDITEMKRAREELISAKEYAEKSDKLKTEFLAQMSHEIRTPMNAIICFTNILKDDYFPEPNGELSEILDSICISGRRIVRTVDLILNASELQIGTYHPTFKNINLEEKIFRTICSEYSALAKQKDLKFNFTNSLSSAVVYGDEYSINQVFINLIDNAIKYTEIGNIDILVDRNEDNNISVSITDTGIGISKEYMPHLFEQFMQEERGYSRRYEGNGLGLSLVKKYCDLNKIGIKVVSKKGVGSKFTITFTNSLGY
jgi:PAS domain S-box-containing protein